MLLNLIIDLKEWYIIGGLVTVIGFLLTGIFFIFRYLINRFLLSIDMRMGSVKKDAEEKWKGYKEMQIEKEKHVTENFSKLSKEVSELRIDFNKLTKDLGEKFIKMSEEREGIIVKFGEVLSEVHAIKQDNEALGNNYNMLIDALSKKKIIKLKD